MQPSSPQTDEWIAELRGELRQWLQKQETKGIPYDITLSALALFTASGAAGNRWPREKFLEIMGTYFDIYEQQLKKL